MTKPQKLLEKIIEGWKEPTWKEGQSNQELLAELRKRIEKEVGKECPDFCFYCPKCQAYMALEILEESFKKI